MIKIGERLKSERKKKGLSIDEVARATKIRPEFISSLESGNYSKLPSSAYIQGFIKNYVAFLGLPERETLAMFRREFDEREFLGVLPESFTRPRKKPILKIRIGLVAIAVFALFAFILGFVFFEYKSAFIDPNLDITRPPENAVISTQTITIEGSTEPNSTVTINDIPTLVDRNGNFRKEIAAFAGPATITIKTQNTFGRKNTVIRHITVQ